VSDFESIKSNWRHILTAVGPSTAGLLVCARPIRFENGTLTLEFGASSEVQKKMCESNGRVGQIESVLRDKLGTTVKIELQIAEGEAETTQMPAQSPTRSQKQNEMMNDPAVKTILMGLDATVTNIEDE
jgi:hypothetical protein